MNLPACLSIYSGDPVTSHEELMLFLKAQQSEIEKLKVEVQKIKTALNPAWAPPRSSPPRPSLYDASAHLKPVRGMQQ